MVPDQPLLPAGRAKEAQRDLFFSARVSSALEAHPDRYPDQHLDDDDPQTPDVDRPRVASLNNVIVFLAVVEVFSVRKELQEVWGHVLWCGDCQKRAPSELKGSSEIDDLDLLSSL